ncbi:MAG: hypothetical protein KDA45_00640, partial [Planctomycetales bacterium]|nr:hypothetical protein [Planctomycetales bacterium]
MTTACRSRCPRPRPRCPGGISLVLLVLCAPPVAAAEIHEHNVDRSYSTTLQYRCLVSVPDDYQAAGEKRWPLILFLHGGGTPNLEKLQQTLKGLTALPAVVVIPICPPSADGPRYTNWNSKHLGYVVREIGKEYRIDEKRRSVIGFSMGGSGAWELPSYEPELFSKCVVLAGVCHPWSLRHYPPTQVWVFVGEKDYMRKEQQETVTSAQRFGVDVV